MQQMPIDESLAFTVQLELAPGLSEVDGRAWRAALLKAWYAQDEVRNFWEFARQRDDEYVEHLKRDPTWEPYAGMDDQALRDNGIRGLCPGGVPGAA